MSQYRYLKLRNGEDIVAMTVVNDSNGTVEMTLPCNIALQPSMVGKGTVIKGTLALVSSAKMEDPDLVIAKFTFEK